MSTNPLNDISKVYLEQVSVSEAKKEKPARWWDDDDDGIGYEKGEVSGKFKRKKKKVEEAIKPNDGNLANNYPPYDKVTRKDQLGGKKKKVTKEGFSNWREDLIEVVDKISKDKNDEKIVEKKINNKIKINPNIGEAVENLGGTLLEMNEIEDFEGVFDELSESEIFLLSDQLIEEVVEEFFYECLEEGYDLGEIENTLLESLEISSALLNEAKVTYGHDTDVKSNRLEKVKTAVKNTGKKLIRGVGYVGGLAVRGAKAVGRELGAGYKRGRHGASSSSSSGSSSGSGSSGSSSSSGGSSSGSGSSRPGLLGRIGSALKSGLKRVIAKGARKVARGAIGVARRMEKEKPSTVHSKAGVRSASPRSGIGGGKRVEVAGERKKEQPVQRVSVRDVTPPKAPKAPVGSSENPRVGQPGPDKPKATTRKVSTRRFGSSSSFTPSGEEAYQKEKKKQETAKSAKSTKSEKTRSSSKRKTKEPNPKKPGAPSLDDLLKSEEFQIDEKTLTGPEIKKKEEVFKSVTLDKLKKQYPEKSAKELESLRYAISTSMAKKIAEQAMEIQQKTQQSGQKDVAQKKIEQQKDRQRQQEVQIMQKKLQALRSAPRGTDPNITA